MADKSQKRNPSVTSITKQLQGMDFPATKQDLINHAQQKGVEESVMNMLSEMDDREYESMKDVMKEYGKKYREAA